MRTALFMWPNRTLYFGPLQHLEAHVYGAAIDGNARFIPDPRISEVIKLTRAEPDRNFGETFLANAVHVSPSRLRHLFRAQTGIAYRRYRTWERLLSAARNLHRVDNLTRAALDAGFSDAAHFSRRYRDTFGVKPSFVFRNLDRFEI